MQEYEKNGVERKFPYCDYEYVPKSDWNYGFSSPVFTLKRRAVTEVPFSGSQPPVVVKARMQKIDWGLEDRYDTVCAKVPHSAAPISEEEVLELYPYGCSRLRMTEMPFVE